VKTDGKGVGGEGHRESKTKKESTKREREKKRKEKRKRERKRREYEDEVKVIGKGNWEKDSLEYERRSNEYKRTNKTVLLFSDRLYTWSCNSIPVPADSDLPQNIQKMERSRKWKVTMT
jgi:hypothetical protein